MPANLVILHCTFITLLTWKQNKHSGGGGSLCPSLPLFTPSPSLVHPSPCPPLPLSSLRPSTLLVHPLATPWPPIVYPLPLTTPCIPPPLDHPLYTPSPCPPLVHPLPLACPPPSSLVQPDTEHIAQSELRLSPKRLHHAGPPPY